MAAAIAYLVTKGEYSDYRVVAVFTEREAALTFLARLTSASCYLRFNDVEESTLNPTVPPDRGSVFDVAMRMDDGQRIHALERTLEESWDESDSEIPERLDLPAYSHLRWRCVEADDGDHALKICNERRLKYVAQLPPQSSGMPAPTKRTFTTQPPNG